MSTMGHGAATLAGNSLGPIESFAQRDLYIARILMLKVYVEQNSFF